MSSLVLHKRNKFNVHWTGIKPTKGDEKRHKQKYYLFFFFCFGSNYKLVLRNPKPFRHSDCFYFIMLNFILFFISWKQPVNGSMIRLAVQGSWFFIFVLLLSFEPFFVNHFPNNFRPNIFWILCVSLRYFDRSAKIDRAEPLPLFDHCFKPIIVTIK